MEMSPEGTVEEERGVVATQDQDADMALVQGQEEEEFEDEDDVDTFLPIDVLSDQGVNARELQNLKKVCTESCAIAALRRLRAERAHDSWSCCERVCARAC